VGGKQAFCDF
jgi:hypothetical protein